MKSTSYFSDDVKEFLYLLAKYDVSYLLVGGEAVIFYGYARLTGDIDIFYDNTSINTGKLFDALVEFWDRAVPGIKSKNELMKKGMVFQFGVPPNRIDLINSIDGVEFEKAWGNKLSDSFVYKKQKHPLYFIGIGDLIKNKKAVHRNKDKDDLRFLKEVQKKMKS